MVSRPVPRDAPVTIATRSICRASGEMTMAPPSPTTSALRASGDHGSCEEYCSGVAVRQAPSFRGRAPERAALDGMLESVRKGGSEVLVLRGEAGIGKTALMQYCARQASGCRVAQVAGVESELEMPFAAMHQLCSPMLGHVDALPEPQRQALRVAFGAEFGKAPDRFVVGLAAL